MSLVGVYLTTALLVCVIAVLGYVLKRVLAFTPYGQAMEGVRVVAIRSLGPKKSIALVAIGEKAYVLGLTDRAISLIDTVHAQDLTESINDPAARKKTLRFPWSLPKEYGGSPRSGS